MMRLSAMWNVMATMTNAYEEILRPWGFDADSVRFVRASANFVCVFRKEGRRHFLRFNLASERSREAVEAEVRLVAWLHSQGVAVAAPVPSAHGRLVETIDTALGQFHAVVFVGLEGDHLETSDCQAEQFQAWGAALGRLHRVMTSYRDPSTANRPTWQNHLALALPYVESDPVLLAEWELLKQWATTLPTGPDDFGLIHFDFESDNLCWHNGMIGILDFDDCAHYWYVADIAYALRDLFAEGADLAHPIVHAFVGGYRGEHHLNEELLGQLPMLLRLHGMYLYGRLSRALDLPADQELPDWLRRLEAKLQHRLEMYRKSLAQ